MITKKIFISSPNDAFPERRRIEAVIARLSARFQGRIGLKPVFWEDKFYKAHETFQTQIDKAAECDLVLTLFKTRLGSRLPDDFEDRLPDGSPYPSGTAYEVLTAIDARKDGKDLPDVYVFRQDKPTTLIALEDEAGRKEMDAQWAQLRAFMETYFYSAAEGYKAAIQFYSNADDLDEQVETLLVQWLDGALGSESVAWPIDIKGSPFRGLEAFGAKHAPVFFGRGRDIERGVGALVGRSDRQHPFLLLLGASGSGKSSLARAGLAPRITAPGVIDGVDVWRVAVFRPGDAPGGALASLAQALFQTVADLPDAEDGRGPALPELSQSDFGTPEALAELLATSPAAAMRPILGALEKVAKADKDLRGYDRAVEARLLLVVDQLDEIFAGDVGEPARAAFAAALQALLECGKVWITATLRSDLYDALQASAPLFALKDGGVMQDVRPPDYAALKEIITEPAEASGLSFETQAEDGYLDDRLLKDADRPDMLPLLQFALSQLFEQRQDRLLTYAAYDAFGGVDGAINAEAEKAFLSAPKAAQQALGPLLRQIAGLSQDGAERVTSRAIHRDISAPNPARDALIGALVNGRILTSSGARLRIAHDRVLRSWARAKDTLDSSRDFLRIRGDVEAAHSRWANKGKAASLFLPPGLPIEEARAILRDYPAELDPALLSYIRKSSSRARLRQNMLIAASIVFAGVAVLAGWFYLQAEEQRQVAEAERAKAQSALSAAMKASNTLLFDVAQKFRDRGVPLSIRTAILEEVRALQETLSSGFEQTPELLRQTAAQLIEQGDVFLREGDAAGALAAYEEGLEIARQLAARDPENTQWQRDVSVSLERIGDVSLRSGDAAGALAAYEEGLEIARQLVARDPANTQWQHDVSISLNKLGDVSLRSGDAAGALAAYEEGLEIARRLAARDPENTQWQRDLSVSLEKIGDVSLRSGDAAGALAAYEEGLEIVRQLAARDPENTQWQRDVSISLNKIGDVSLRSGDAAGALAAYEEGLEIARRLAARDPENTQWQRDVSVSLEKIGDVSLRSGDAAGALAAYEEGLEIAHLLAARDPENTQWQRDVSLSLERIGDVSLRSGDAAGALAAYEEGLEIRRRLAAGDPENTQWQTDVAFSHYELASAGKDPRENLEQAIAILEPLLAADKLSAQQKDWLPIFKAALAKLDDPPQ